MATLPNLHVNANSTNGPRNWTTQQWDSGTGWFSPTLSLTTPVTTSFLLEAFPSDLANVDTLTVSGTARTTIIAIDDTYVLRMRIVRESNGAVLAAADSGGTFQLVATDLVSQGVNFNNVAFTYVNTSATLTDWNDARLEIQAEQTVRNMADDASAVKMESNTTGTDNYDFTGTYTLSFTEQFGASAQSGSGTLSAVGNGVTKPTLVAPTDDATIDISSGYTFDWTHNDLNGTTQGGYRIRRRRPV